MMHSDVVLIGVDGGATEAKAHAAACDDIEQPTSFALRNETASRVYARVSSFAPLPVAEQLARRNDQPLELSAEETEQGRLYVRATAEAIAKVAAQCGGRRLVVGAGMPGLKTADGRGINAINNGPRIPDYLDCLEQELANQGLELASPIAALGSDADYCGLGEQFAADGLFREVDNAYYVGCGTGIADAMKLGGKLVPFDRATSWLLKSWQIPSALGPTFEKLVSAGSLNRVFAALSAAGTPTGTQPQIETEPGRTGAASFPERAAVDGHPLARAWMSTAATVMAELIFERIETIRNGRADVPHRGQAYAGLDPKHAYRGTLLERVIIGQRVGQVYAEPAYRAVFGDTLDGCLAQLIAESGDTEMAAALLDNDGLREGFIRASKLRAAPALGAAIAAVQALASSPR